MKTVVKDTLDIRHRETGEGRDWIGARIRASEFGLAILGYGANSAANRGRSQGKDGRISHLDHPANHWMRRWKSSRKC